MITPEDIVREVRVAETRIRPNIRKTEIIQSTLGGLRKEFPVFLKLENTQHTGSFKARGSLNKVLSLTESERTKGVITASTGNHGMGVAKALQLTGVKGSIFLPRNASKAKIKKLRSFGANLEFVEGSPLETELYAKRIAAETGTNWISPYNDIRIIGGQGTIALESIEQLPGIRRAFVTVGGGGLVSGIASVLKFMLPEIQIIGCVPENSPEMCLSVQAGHIVHLPEEKETLSDGSAGGAEDDSITFPLCAELIDEWVLISEHEIANAMRMIYYEHDMIIEGSAGVAAAACLKHADKTDRDLVIICGGNVDADRFQKLVQGDAGLGFDTL
jgi:threonine dehydratase